MVLDTSAYSRMRVGHADTLDLVADASTVLLPTVVIGELESGFLRGARHPEHMRALDEFLAQPYVCIVDVTRSVARHYATVHDQLRSAGTPIPTNDIWITAVALEHNARLLTFDKHFAHVRGLWHTLLEI